MILADVGMQDGQGKLNLLGVGWSQISVGPNGLTSEMTVAALLEVPWDACNRELEVTLELQNEDREPVTLPHQSGALQPVRVSQKLVAPVPAGAPNGSPGRVNMMVRIQGGLPLSPGSWYCWRAAVDGEQRDEWTARFYIRRQPTAPTFGN